MKNKLTDEDIIKTTTGVRIDLEAIHIQPGVGSGFVVLTGTRILSFDTPYEAVELLAQMLNHAQLKANEIHKGK